MIKHGTSDDQIIAGRFVLSKEDFQPIYEVFPNAVVQAFISSCDSANVGEMIGPDPVLFPGACYCFAGLVGKDLLGPVQVAKSKLAVNDGICVFASHLQTHTAGGKWQGATNLQELNLSLFDYARTNARHSDENKHVDSIFGTKPGSLNPFENFAVNSLDNLAPSGQSDRRSADGPRVRSNSSSSDLDAVSKNVEALLSKEETNRNGLTAMANRYVSSRRRLQPSFFKMRNGASDYIKNCYYDWRALGCQIIYAVVKGARTKGDDSLSKAFEKFEKGIEAFADEGAYTFGKKESGYLPLSELERDRLFKALAEVKNSWNDYDDLKHLLNKEAVKQDKGGAILGELADLNAQIAAFHQSFLHAYFPDLVEDVLKKRSLAITGYVNAALNNADKASAAEDLKTLCDQINCLTDIPVGPEFDKQFILPKLTKPAANR